MMHSPESVLIFPGNSFQLEIDSQWCHFSIIHSINESFVTRHNQLENLLIVDANLIPLPSSEFRRNTQIIV